MTVVEQESQASMRPYLRDFDDMNDLSVFYTVISYEKVRISILSVFYTIKYQGKPNKAIFQENKCTKYSYIYLRVS